MTRQINPAGLEIIKRSEGLRLDAYRDIAGVWTIGRGHAGVAPGTVITPEIAEQLLRADLAHAEQAVERATHDVPTSDNQFSAMASLAFNIGTGGFRVSTALKMHRLQQFKAAGDAFLLWDKAHVEGRLVVVPALSRRRGEERWLYLAASSAEPPADPDHSANDLNRAELDRLNRR